MNCKPGDLAIVVRTSPLWPKYLGMIVTVGERYTGFDAPPDGEWYVGHPTFKREHTCFDRDMRPIRPDETPEQSAEAMRLLHKLPTPVETVKKEAV